MKLVFARILLWYFRICAKLQLWKVSPTIIGVTGSAGKTSTMHAIAAVLSPTHTLKMSHKANSESGLPLDILGLSLKHYTPLEWLKLVFLAPLQLLFFWPKYQLYIAEMGIDGPLPPKNMSYLLSIFQPKIGVLLNAQPVHSQGFDEFVPKDLSQAQRKQAIKQAIAQEKGKLITHLPSDGLAVLTADEPAVAALAVQTQATTQLFGAQKQARIQIVSTKQTLAGTQFTLADTQMATKTTLSFEHQALPTNFGYSLAAACAVGTFFAVPLATAGGNIVQNYLVPPGRSSLIPGIHETTILDSTYNASTQTMLDMLDLLDTIAPKRKIAVLGDMREIGMLTQTEHELVAQKASAVCNLVVLVGPLMQQHALPVLKHTKVTTVWFASAKEAGEYLQNNLQKQDVVLVKASQNTLLLESTVELLMRYPADAKKLLCRRDSFWNNERKKLGYSP